MSKAFGQGKVHTVTADAHGGFRPKLERLKPGVTSVWSDLRLLEVGAAWGLFQLLTPLSIVSCVGLLCCAGTCRLARHDAL